MFSDAIDVVLHAGSAIAKACLGLPVEVIESEGKSVIVKLNAAEVVFIVWVNMMNATSAHYMRQQAYPWKRVADISE